MASAAKQKTERYRGKMRETLKTEVLTIDVIIDDFYEGFSYDTRKKDLVMRSFYFYLHLHTLFHNTALM